MSANRDLPIPKRLVAVNAEITPILSTAPADSGKEYRNPIKTDQDEAEMAAMIFQVFGDPVQD